MRILAIDGGGVRGYYSVNLLKQISEKLGVTFYKDFDLIVGTSTGSIIAAGLACDFQLEKICADYLEMSQYIFKSTQYIFGGIFGPRYSSDKLYETMKKEFQDLSFKDAKTGLIITATDISIGRLCVFKSDYGSQAFKSARKENPATVDPFEIETGIVLADAVFTSCSAPIYFTPAKIDGNLYADGGLWSNDPSLIGITEAIRTFGVNLDEIKLMSIGNGIGKGYYGSDVDKPWGLLNSWGIKKFIDMLFNLQAATAAHSSRSLLKPENYIKINFESDAPLGLDDITIFDQLKDQAVKDFDDREQDIKKFLAK